MTTRLSNESDMRSTTSPEPCPVCREPGFEAEIVEIDIGVGIERYPIGGECKVCGGVLICSECGVWGADHDDRPDIEHARFCSRRSAPKAPA